MTDKSERKRKDGMKIAFVHHKGGSGKTTSCINVAGYLALWGKRVLVLDLDPQGNATSGLGIDKNLLSQDGIRGSIVETKSGAHIAWFPYKPQTLDGVEEHYDYILIDPPPGDGIIPALKLVNFAIIPLDGLFALEGLSNLSKTLKNLNRNGGEVEPRMALMNKVRLMGSWAAGVQMEGLSGYTIPLSGKVHQSQVKGMPLSHFAPRSGVGRAYRRVALEIARW